MAEVGGANRNEMNWKEIMAPIAEKIIYRYKRGFVKFSRSEDSVSGGCFSLPNCEIQGFQDSPVL